MVTTRTPLNRPRLNHAFTSEALALFAELEHAPDQRSPDFKAKARELAYLLGLGTEWFLSGCSVLDRRDGPVHSSSEYVEFHDWHHCREMRLALLAALGTQRQ
jgi:hypothetical protein